MVISRAAGCPADQQGKHTSPGREVAYGIKLLCSQNGDRFAALQAENLRRSCREILSPRP